MTHIRWRFGGLRIGSKSRVLSLLLPMARGLMGTLMKGIRACLVEEFSSVSCSESAGECNEPPASGGRAAKVTMMFDQRSRAPVAITILVKNPRCRTHDGCRILYRDIGDYLKQRAEVSSILRRCRVYLRDITDWEEITPNEHYDWIRQRDSCL